MACGISVPARAGPPTTPRRTPTAMRKTLVVLGALGFLLVAAGVGALRHGT